MPTTIRLEDEVKRELDRLQGDFLAERGERVSHSELLARLLRFARLHEEALFDEDTHARRPNRDDLQRWQDGMPDHPVDVRARDLKKALYRDRP